MPHKSFKRQNGRRIELIHKEHMGGGLSEAETTELAELEEWVGEHMARKHPRDTTVLDEMEAWLNEMRAKIKAKKEADE